MLTKVRIQNFRAIEDLELELRPFQVLVGENNSGKTSFLDALVALQKMSTFELAQAWTGARFSFNRNVRANATSRRMEWTVEAEPGVQYSLAFGGALGVLEESLTVETVNVFQRVRQGDGTLKSPVPVKPPGPPDPGSGSVMLATKRGPKSAPLRAALSSMRRYFLHPRMMARPAQTDADIEEDGTGFPAFLDRLQNTAPEAFEALQERARAMFPRFRFVRTPALETGEREIAIVERGHSGLIYGSQVSDGLMLTIGYLALALQPSDPPSLLMLDEPEMGMHMDRANFLVDLLRGLSQGKFGPPVQVIVTTHSPDVVDYLEPDELVIFRRNEAGAVQAKRASDVPDLKSRMKGFNLGEFWSNYGEGGLLGEEQA